jgi:hypothetical protein
MKKIVRDTVAALVVISVVGCAASGDQTADGGSDECSSLKTGAAGMLIGAALGAAVNGSKGAAQGAVAGAAIGAIGCMTMNYKTKKVRSAEVVNDDYIRDHKQLPATPVVTAYELSAPRSAVRGQAVNVNSAITVVDGQSQPIRSIEEKLYIVSPDGKRKALKTKAPMSLDGGGEYNNSFSFSPPEGAPEGSYKLESELYINEKIADKSSTPMRLAYDANSVMTLALLQ